MIKSEDINLIDDSMYELFQTELLTNVNDIVNTLNNNEIISKENIDTITVFYQSIEGAARIIGFKPVEKIIEELITLLRFMKEECDKPTCQKNIVEVISDTNLTLLEISEKTKVEISNDIEMVSAEIDEKYNKIIELKTNVLKNKDTGDVYKSEDKKEKIKKKKVQEYSDVSMIDLFLIEVENNSRVLEEKLIDAEGNTSEEYIEPLMRAAHSIKGAARIVGLDIPVKLAHSMEDILQKAMNGNIELNSVIIDELLKSTDIFKRLIGLSPETIENWFLDQEEEIKLIIKNLDDIANGKGIIKESKKSEKKQKEIVEGIEKSEKKERSKSKPKQNDTNDEGTYVRVLSKNLNRLLGLAGESLVEARTLRPLIYPLNVIKNSYSGLESLSEELYHLIQNTVIDEDIKNRITKLTDRVESIKDLLAEYTGKFEKYSRRLELLTEKMHNEVLASRMVPLSKGIVGFKRMVRDISKSLNKKVDFEIIGGNTKIDRDILEKLESPLMHILRNALSHGLETPIERRDKKKEEVGSLVLKAEHRAGMFHISIADDGRGIDMERLRQTVVDKGYVTKNMAKSMNDSELIDFLFLPGFSTASEVSEISGRGVGLDVVYSMVGEVSGTVNLVSVKGKGTTFNLQLPLTLSVVRALLVDINDEPYAIPLSKIDHIIELNQNELKSTEEHQYFNFNGENIGLVSALQVLEIEGNKDFTFPIKTIIISDRMNKYALVVDKILGERELVIRPLDSRLGKIQNISAVAIMENSLPVIILDADDLVRSIDSVISKTNLTRIKRSVSKETVKRKKILIVDDSLTVREVERRLLENAGYEVSSAVDGMEGWNMVQKSDFDLIISDIDMPRMNGIQFVSTVRSDKKYRDIPIIIISYKDREEDKIKGLKAGADHYLTKSSFHDKNFITTVRDLVGDN